MRHLFRLLLATAALVPTTGLAQGQPARGLSHLQRGQYVLAEQALRPLVRDQPGNHGARAGLARALVAQGACAEAFEHFEVLALAGRGEPMLWRAEALCWSRLAMPERAEPLLRDAVEVAPDRAVFWNDLGQVAIALGDEATLLASIAELDRLPRGVWMSAALEAEAALELGADEVDGLLFALDAATASLGSHPARAQSDVLSGLRWLDLGHPELAEQDFANAARRQRRALRPRLLKAEAARRQGHAEVALFVLNASTERRGELSVLNVAIEARVLADLGRVDEARALLDELAGSDDPEVLLSRWYLAAPSERPAFAADFALVNRAADRDVTDLLPPESP